MKITKKQMKKQKGMNSITKSNFANGFKPPVYRNMAPAGQLEHFVKVQKGTPYVNESNFK